MSYSDLVIIWQEAPAIWDAFLNTLIILCISGLSSLLLGIVLTTLLMAKNKVVSYSAIGFCESMRCVPFLLFVYIIYFGLPSFGIQLSNWTTGVSALILYHSAYMAIVFKAAWLDIPKDTIDAGKAYGFHGVTLIRRIIVPPVLIRAVPMVGNQMIQILKDSAFLGIIAVAELTAAMNSIQSTHFIPFASFITAMLLYWVICLVIESVTTYFTQKVEARRA